MASPVEKWAGKGKSAFGSAGRVDRAHGDSVKAGHKAFEGAKDLAFRGPVSGNIDKRAEHHEKIASLASAAVSHYERAGMKSMMDSAKVLADKHGAIAEKARGLSARAKEASSGEWDEAKHPRDSSGKFGG